MISPCLNVLSRSIDGGFNWFNSFEAKIWFLRLYYGDNRVDYSSLNPASVIFTDKLHIEKPRFEM